MVEGDVLLVCRLYSPANGTYVVAYGAVLVMVAPRYRSQYEANSDVFVIREDLSTPGRVFVQAYDGYYVGACGRRMKVVLDCPSTGPSKWESLKLEPVPGHVDLWALRGHDHVNEKMLMANSGTELFDRAPRVELGSSRATCLLEDVHWEAFRLERVVLIDTTADMRRTGLLLGALDRTKNRISNNN